MACFFVPTVSQLITSSPLQNYPELTPSVFWSKKGVRFVKGFLTLRFCCLCVYLFVCLCVCLCVWLFFILRRVAEQWSSSSPRSRVCALCLLFLCVCFCLIAFCFASVYVCFFTGSRAGGRCYNHRALGLPRGDADPSQEPERAPDIASVSGILLRLFARLDGD